MIKTFTMDFPNFSEKEFPCPCGCGKNDVDGALLYVLQFLRNKHGKVTITCGVRCQKYNDQLKGSIPTSDHVRGKAADFKIAGFGNLSSQKKIMEEMKNLPGFSYAYCNGCIMYANGVTKSYPAPWMGTAIHVSVK